MKHFRPAFAIVLALLVTLTSQQMAVARGQAAVAGEMVLCTALNGVVTVKVDASGKPTGPAHICPDCALSLIVALDAPDLPGAAHTLRAVTFATVEIPAHVQHPATVPLARGPPLSV